MGLAPQDGDTALTIGAMKGSVETVEVLPTEGAINLRLNAAAKVYSGDTLLGEGTKVALERLEPGELSLRFEAEGFDTLEETVDVVAGERLVLALVLDLHGRGDAGQGVCHWRQFILDL